MNLGTEELLALLRDPTLKPASIAEEMACAGLPAAPETELVQARELLAAWGPREGGDAPAGEVLALVQGAALLCEPLGFSLVRAAGEAARQDLLREVAQAGPKALGKEAKRELQRLKQKGVKVAALAPKGAPVVKTTSTEVDPGCYATSVDSWGERAVWMARAARGGVELVQVVLSDVKGILAVDALVLPRRAYKAFVKKMPRGGVVSTAEVPRAHARWVIAQAAETGSRNGFSPPQTYATALHALGPVPDAEPPHPAESLDLGPDGELPHQLAGAALFSDPLFLSWIPEEEPLRAFGKKFDEISQSQLYVDEAQRQAALDAAADEAAAAYFDEARKLRYARRLREMALVLEAEQRIDAARTALACARALFGRGGTAQPFCKALFGHAMERRAEAPKSSDGGQLITA